MSYRIDVIADSVAEAVRYAGGLMFDRRLAGWDVIVTSDDVAHVRALTILGARLRPLGGPEDQPLPAHWGAATVVGPVAASRLGGSYVLQWGQQRDDSTAGPMTPLCHDLSAAARSFKAHALRAAGLPSDVDHIEQFWGSPHGAAGLRPTASWPPVLTRGRAVSRPPNAVGG
ncbi:hypothetical protein ACQI4F_04040 [Mycolicibacterium vaccae]|uniref:hypothetical protein n=1 Tax=Mycolicibacterium vaccae TaxID=1810 RepID=UPI003CF92D78